ncbi:unnamed protein product [Clonostachys rhizophaga]|uniref:Uncharacterized protein n=1 Tax=Clonostachys rhizophaga TaxID=160324 RepID=A0A9N9VE64_9HYPO|nr:unnamed protein product [Clonostachys rhizophaga]
MHFPNVLLSIVAVASVTTATLSERTYGEPISHEVREYAQAHGDMLASRDEYISKRDLFRRLGGPTVCRGQTKPYDCSEAVPGPDTWAQRWRKCGTCDKKAKPGSKCNC